jgi:uncharacterized membrane protein
MMLGLGQDNTPAGTRIMIALFLLALVIAVGLLFRRLHEMDKILVQFRERLEFLEDRRQSPSGNQITSVTEIKQEHKPLFQDDFGPPSTPTLPESQPPKTVPSSRVDSSWLLNLPLWQQVKSKILGQNPLARLAVVLVLLGVGFLAKLAVGKGIVPLWLRLSMMALLGLLLMWWGWHAQSKQPVFARLSLGGGLATLYLVLYASCLLWTLVPIGMGFPLMLTTVAAGTLIGFLLHSQSLVGFAYLGAYLLPLLHPQVAEDPRPLLGYLTLFSFSCFFLLRQRPWPALGAMVLAGSTILPALWAIQGQEGLWSSWLSGYIFLQWILLLISGHVLSKLRGKTATTLVLGSTLTAFGAQSALFNDQPSLLAISSLVFALGHLLLARSEKNQQQTLTLTAIHALMALGLATVALPLALTERWTAAAWSIEGVIVYWVGIRERRFLLQLIGVGLLFAAGIAFFSDLPDPWWALSLGSLLLILSALGMARLATPGEMGVPRFNTFVRIAALFWSLPFWFLFLLGFGHAWFQEEVTAVFLAIGPLVAFLALIAHRHQNWQFLALLGTFFLPLALMGATLSFTHEVPIRLSLWLGYAFWMMFLSQMPKPTPWRYLQAMAALWLLLTLATQLGGKLLGLWSLGEGWTTGLSLLMFLGHFFLLKPQLMRPTQEKYSAVFDQWLMIFPFWIGVSSLALGHFGNAFPLAYFPLLNPLECALLISILYGWREKPILSSKALISQTSLVGLVIFLFGLGAISRAVAHGTDLSWQYQALVASSLWQGLISVWMTLGGTFAMVLGTNRAHRLLWFSGASLLGLVTLKLFFIDLRFADAWERAAAFLIAGLLMLLVAYKAPLPPAGKESP